MDASTACNPSEPTPDSNHAPESSFDQRAADALAASLAASLVATSGKSLERLAGEADVLARLDELRATDPVGYASAIEKLDEISRGRHIDVDGKPYTVCPDLALNGAAVDYAHALRDGRLITEASHALKIAALRWTDTVGAKTSEHAALADGLRRAAVRVEKGELAAAKELTATLLAPHFEPASAANAASLEHWRNEDKMRRATVPPDLSELVAIGATLLHFDHERFVAVLEDARAQADGWAHDGDGAEEQILDTMVHDARSRAIPMHELLVGNLDAVRARAEQHTTAQVRDAAAILEHERQLKDWIALGSKLIDHPTMLVSNGDDGMSRIAFAMEVAERAVASASEAMSPADELRFVDWFEATCREAVRLGGGGASNAIWHLLVADRGEHDASQSRSSRMDASEGNLDDPDEFFAACRHYAFTVCAGASCYGADRLVKLIDMKGEAIDDYAPCCNEAGDQGLDAVGFATADLMKALVRGKNDELAEALATYAYAMEQIAGEYSLTPTYRCGLIAWMAKRGLFEPEVVSGQYTTLTPDEMAQLPDDDDDDEVDLEEMLPRLRTVQASGVAPAVTRALVAEIDRLRSVASGGGLEVIASDDFDPAADAAVNAALDRAGEP